MKLPEPLYRAVLLRRYKRFLADVELENGRRAVAHVADPGRLPGLAVPGAELWLSGHRDPRRKLPFRVELIRQGRALVGVNSANPNRLAREGFARGLIGFARGFALARREPRLASGGRLDFLLRDPWGRELWVEVKGVTWRAEGRTAAFPDAPTARGRRHLEALIGRLREGGAAALLFVVQRADVESVRAAAEVDPDYAELLHAGRALGLRVEAWRCRVNQRAIELDAPLPVV